MFKAIFIGGGVLWVACYVASKYALKQLQAKQNPLAPFGNQ
jgi:hypothetical protein